MSNATGNGKMFFILALLAVGFAVASSAVTMPTAAFASSGYDDDKNDCTCNNDDDNGDDNGHDYYKHTSYNSKDDNGDDNCDDDDNGDDNGHDHYWSGFKDSAALSIKLPGVHLSLS
jgi:hypothetical protein